MVLYEAAAPTWPMLAMRPRNFFCIAFNLLAAEAMDASRYESVDVEAGSSAVQQGAALIDVRCETLIGKLGCQERPVKRGRTPERQTLGARWGSAPNILRAPAPWNDRSCNSPLEGIAVCTAPPPSPATAAAPALLAPLSCTLLSIPCPRLQDTTGVCHGPCPRRQEHTVDGADG